LQLNQFIVPILNALELKDNHKSELRTTPSRKKRKMQIN